MDSKITLTDGTIIKCILNGNNYITTKNVDNVDFSDKNFKEIIVDDEILYNQKCTNVFKQDDGTHIIFRAKTPDEIKMDEQDEIIDDLLTYILKRG